MSLEKATSIVIRHADFSESSRVVTVFSREFGKFAALAKGAKRLKGPFDAGLDLLSESRIVFIRKSSGTLNLLTESRLIRRFQPQNSGSKSGLSSLYGGYYVAELLNGLTEDFNPEPEVYDLATSTLAALSTPDQLPSPVIIQFEISFLQLIGLLPNLFDCSVCGEPVEKDGKFAHWVSQGGVLCGACRREEFSGISISTGSIEILRRLTQKSPEILNNIKFSQQQTEECHRLAVSAITHALGRRPSTLRYIQI
ncbi:MAG TPA: DNA repair protein RecO [Planctomycetaceae bacterium]|nr:DNA repair protein RecO [Planctomycetaceae bacterium]